MCTLLFVWLFLDSSIFSEATRLLYLPSKDNVREQHHPIYYPVSYVTSHRFFIIFVDVMIVWFPKISLPTPWMVIGNSEGGGGLRHNFLKEIMKLN